MPSQISINWPDVNNLMYFEAIIKPDENLWKGASFAFTITVCDEYPIQPPKVLSKKVNILKDVLENIPSKFGPRWQSLFKHIKGRLETC